MKASKDLTNGEDDGPSEGYTCVPYASLRDENDPSCDDHALYPEYLQAVCARTFGGLPSDYSPSPIGGWYADLENYPITEHGDRSYCDTTRSFDEVDESPKATDMVPLLSGPFDRCDRDSYCAAQESILAVFSTASEFLEIDPWCNDADGGDSGRPGPWRCVGSSEEPACGHVGEQSICPIVGPAGKEYCVIASSEVDASAACKAVCSKAHAAYDSQYGTTYDDLLDCGVFDDNVMKWVENVPVECFNVDFEITTAYKPFHYAKVPTLDIGSPECQYSIAPATATIRN